MRSVASRASAASTPAVMQYAVQSGLRRRRSPLWLRARTRSAAMLEMPRCGPPKPRSPRRVEERDAEVEGPVEERFGLALGDVVAPDLGGAESERRDREAAAPSARRGSVVLMGSDDDIRRASARIAEPQVRATPRIRRRASSRVRGSPRHERCSMALPMLHQSALVVLFVSLCLPRIALAQQRAKPRCRADEHDIAVVRAPAAQATASQPPAPCPAPEAPPASVRPTGSVGVSIGVATVNGGAYAARASAPETAASTPG